MTRKKRTVEEMLEDICGACNKPFKTRQGLSAHQSMSKKCAWYKKGKLREIFEFDPVEMSREDGNVVVEPGRRVNTQF